MLTKLLQNNIPYCKEEVVLVLEEMETVGYIIHLCIESRDSFYVTMAHSLLGALDHSIFSDGTPEPPLQNCLFDKLLKLSNSEGGNYMKEFDWVDQLMESFSEVDEQSRSGDARCNVYEEDRRRFTTSWREKDIVAWDQDNVLDWLFSLATTNGWDCSILQSESFQFVSGKQLHEMTEYQLRHLEPTYGFAIWHEIQSLKQTKLKAASNSFFTNNTCITDTHSQNIQQTQLQFPIQRQASCVDVDTLDTRPYHQTSSMVYRQLSLPIMHTGFSDPASVALPTQQFVNHNICSMSSEAVYTDISHAIRPHQQHPLISPTIAYPTCTRNNQLHLTSDMFPNQNYALNPPMYSNQPYQNYTEYFVDNTEQSISINTSTLIDLTQTNITTHHTHQCMDMDIQPTMQSPESELGLDIQHKPFSFPDFHAQKSTTSTADIKIHTPQSFLPINTHESMTSDSNPQYFNQSTQKYVTSAVNQESNTLQPYPSHPAQESMPSEEASFTDLIPLSVSDFDFYRQEQSTTSVESGDDSCDSSSESNRATSMSTEDQSDTSSTEDGSLFDLFDFLTDDSVTESAECLTTSKCTESITKCAESVTKCTENVTTPSVRKLSQSSIPDEEMNCAENSLKTTKKARRNPPKRRKGPRRVPLWEFLYQTLVNPAYCPSHICWEDQSEGQFRFVQSEAVAQLWGGAKNNPSMTYQKLSRAMRHYYKRGIMQRMVDRLVYKFTPNSMELLIDRYGTGESESVL